MGPWLQVMAAVDEAEARGDAIGALLLMEDHMVGPDGEVFWKHWRMKRLAQMHLFGAVMPGWVTSRWILEQALFSMHEGRRGIWNRAEAIAVGVRGGVDNLEGVDEIDARSRVLDRDWVFRQSALYDLGGLEHFLRNQATPDLVAGADSIREWAQTAMGGFQLLSSDPRETTWLNLATGARRSGPNIGSAALMDVGEHVIGRLVPIDGGYLFETQPVRVPEDLARRVAAEPSAWVELLSSTRPGPGDHPIVTHGLHYQCFDSDVPPIVWQLVVDDFATAGGLDPERDDFEPALARAVLRTARHALRHRRGERPPGAVDVWPCLAAALMTPYLLTGLARAAGPDDVATFDELSTVLAEPGATVCRNLAAEIADAA